MPIHSKTIKSFMVTKIRNAIKYPHKIVPYSIYQFNRLRIAKVIIGGQVYHRYKGELYPDYLNHGNACQFITDKALQYCQGKGIDIGSADWPLPGSIPVENSTNLNAYCLDAFADESLDYVFSSHCLEHLEEWERAISLWISKLRFSGILFLYLPHESMKLWNPLGPWVGLSHKWTPKCETLIPYLSNSGMKILDYHSFRDNYWSFHVIAQRIKK